MSTAQEREAAFRADLKALLKRHKAELDITDDGKPYGMHKAIVEVTLDGEWDEDGKVVQEFTEFRL